MGRVGISEYQVFKVAELLTTAGVKPTVDAIRQELGNTGSRTTINNYLKSWREKRAERESAGVNLGDHLMKVLTEQSELLLDLLERAASEKFSQKAKLFETELVEKGALLQQRDSELQSLRSQISATQTELEEIKLVLQHSQASLADKQEDIQSLRESLAKETGRREQLDQLTLELREQVKLAQKELKSTATRNEILAESLAAKTTELRQFQANDRDQRAAIKDKDGQIAKLTKDLNGARHSAEKEIARLSVSVERLLKSGKRKSATTRR